MYWANLLHIYQPPGQKEEILKKVVAESYRPILEVLEQRPGVKISLNICGSLTEQLANFGFIDILEKIKILAEKGQIELVGSAKYHPILPLIPKKEVIRQIKLNEAINQKYFGKIWRPRPKGFFLPELAYNKKTARIIEQLGYQWIVLDELTYQGKLGQVSFDKLYDIKLYPDQPKRTLKVVFRNRGMSDIFFGKWLDSTDKFWHALESDGRSDKCLVTCFDGENLGHHRKGRTEIWAQILDDKQIKAITYSELLEFLRGTPEEKVEPIDGSWASSEKDLEKNIPYSLWQHPGNQLHQLQWQLTNLVLKNINQIEKDTNFSQARKLLDKSLASDQYWWASIKPWWNPGIIERRVKKFGEIIELLKNSLLPDVKKKGRELIEKILNELDRRKKSGRYKITKSIGD